MSSLPLGLNLASQEPRIPGTYFFSLSSFRVREISTSVTSLTYIFSASSKKCCKVELFLPLRPCLLLLLEGKINFGTFSSRSLVHQTKILFYKAPRHGKRDVVLWRQILSPLLKMKTFSFHKKAPAAD